MADNESQSVEAAIITAEAGVVDATAEAAARALAAAEEASRLNAVAAANAEESARQRTAEIAAAAGDALAAQENRLSQHEARLAETETQWQSLNSRLTEQEANRQRTEEALQGIAAGLAALTPPPLPEPETAETDPKTLQKEGEGAPKEPAKPEGKKRHRWT